MFEGSVSLIPSIWASMISWFTPTVLFVFLNLMIGTIVITSSLATQKGNEQQNQNDPRPQQLPRSPSVLQRLKSINYYTQRWQQSHTNFAQTPGMDAHFTSHHLTREHEPQEYQPQATHQWTRGSPTVLERLKSFNLYNHLSQEPTKSKPLEAADTRYTPESDHEQKEHKQESSEEDEIQEEKQTLDEVYSQLKGGHVGRTKSDTKPTAEETLKKLPKKMKKCASAKSAFSHFEVEDIVERRRPATVREGKAKATQEDDDDEVDAKADVFINEFRQQLKLQRIDSFVKEQGDDQ